MKTTPPPTPPKEGGDPLDEELEKLKAKLAEKYLKKNPITHPLGNYVKKVFVDAYTMGINIIDIL